MDSFVVSALKYRPATFRSVVGQDAVTTTLKNAIKSKKLAHAYLFCGPRGVGKTTCARIFAKTINCEHLTEDFEACNECESCRSFNEQRSFNIHELDAASNNGVDDIRSLTDQVRIPPQIGKYSVYIIDEVHMLSQGAFNAFLKTLEEPPSHAIFILATTEKHKIIPTILSRCQIYDFNRISISDTVRHLKYVAEQESVVIDESAMNIIAQKSDGGMRDALSIFDQLVSFSGNRITYQEVIENLNVLDYEYYFNVVNAFLEGNVSKTLLIFNEILNKGFEAQHFVTGLSSHLRDLLVCKDPVTLPLLEVGSDIAMKYREQAASCPVNFIFEALSISNECDLNYRISKNKRLLVELALIKICQLSGKGRDVTTESAKNPLQKINSENTPSENPVAAGSSNNEQKTALASSEQKLNDNGKIETEKQPNPANNETASSELKKEPIENKHRPVSISISSFKNESANSSEVVSEPENDLKKVQSFTQEELEVHWKKYINAHRDVPETKMFLETHIPFKAAENIVGIKVDNPFQEKELKQMDVLNFLRKELKNDEIRLQIDYAVDEQRRIIQTPNEIYARMANDYPDIEDIRKNLDLEIND